MMVHKQMKIDFQIPQIASQQALIEQDDQLQSALLSVLKKVAKLVRNPISCHLLYAWPTSEHSKSEYWVQIFLATLHQHLLCAGIMPIIDIIDYKKTDTIYSFAQHANMSKYVLIFGTPSMRAQLSANDWQPEKVTFAQALVKHHRDGNFLNRFIPIVLGESIHDCFSDFIELANTYSWHDQNYIDQLKWLLNQLLFGGQSNAVYEAYWQPLLNPFSSVERLQRQPICNQQAAEHIKQAQLKLVQTTQYQFVRQERKPESLLRLIKSKLNTDPNPGFCDFNGQFQLPNLATYFTGRTDEIRMLQHFFLDQRADNVLKTMCLSGIIGIGKSQCVRRFIQMLIDKKDTTFQNYIWFVAGVDDRSLTPIILNRQFFMLAMLLGYDPLSFDNNQEMYQKVYASLSKRGNSFIAFDQAFQYVDIQAFLPPQNNQFAYCITTTNSHQEDWPTELTFNVIRALIAQSTIDYITLYLTEEIQYEFESQNEIIELSNRCQQHPLMLTQALTYIVNNNISIEDFLRQWPQNTIAMLDYPVYSNCQYTDENSEHYDIYEIIRPAIFTKCLLASNRLSQSAKNLLQLITCNDHIDSLSIDALVKSDHFENIEAILSACIDLLRIGLISPAMTKGALEFCGIFRDIIRVMCKADVMEKFQLPDLEKTNRKPNDTPSNKSVAAVTALGFFSPNSGRKNPQNKSVQIILNTCYVAH